MTLIPADQHVFDRALVARRRARAAGGFAGSEALLVHVAAGLADRLLDIRREFRTVLDLGCHTGQLARALAGRPDIELLVQADLAPAMAGRAGAPGRPALAADEEFLPFAPASFDLAVSALSLHWVNDLPGTLIQLRAALRPDGLLVAALLGGETLWELRQALYETEAALRGGVSPRISPFVQLKDAAGLLQRAGFALPVADTDRVTLTYPDVFALLAELRAMGETSAVTARDPRIVPRRFWPEVASRYAARFAEPDGRIPASFEVLWLTGWAPHASQPRLLKPGSARSRLADALGTIERPAGDTAGR